ncbi:MAG: UDP-N-acetylglucosamine--N-acetylmuramyl-(pentapeptide) pyrophosphoryl-undecaprenol N-acetylglucosamine transferase [Clostridia bacterium]|nr:UDP-N-acetylglucosamine--N-acetylmuramyl-(pentapeptide) pyrophosphoryl-undecaprenol N-acetylglucosamine transferase [Clostridia bacterium]
MKKILFTGGGSAGHVLPNVALIEELLSTGEADVCYIGTDGIEKKLIAEWKIPYYQIECPKFVRGGGWKAFKQNVKIPLALRRAEKQALDGLKQFRPDLVFSKGGYVALPVIRAAKKLRIPCFAHESDLSVGLANRLSAGKCKHVFTSFPETAKKIRRGKYSGALIRRNVLSATRADARRQFGIPFGEKVLLVFGGGSGSARINDSVRKHLKTLTDRYFVLHVCGKGNLAQSNFQNYAQYEFISDMGRAYAAADVIVSRAGSGTIFEILALKKPAVLVPLEGQTRGDQAQNAAYFAQKGLCKVLPQSRLDELPEAVENALRDDGLRLRLLDANFLRGNDEILREIRKTLAQ